MSEQAPDNSQNEIGMAPAVAVGGVMSDRWQWPIYSGLVSGSPLPAKDCFHPMPDKGLGQLDEMYEELAEQLKETYKKIGQKIVLITHSLSSPFGMNFALDNPHIVAGLIALAGVQEGIERETPAATLLKWGVGNPDTAKDLQADSEFITANKERVATEWSPDASMHLISPTTDILIPCPQGLGVQLPEGQQAEKRIVMPWGVPRIVMRRVFGMPEDAQPLRSVVAADHATIAVNPSVIRYTRQIRREIVGDTENLVYAPSVAPELAVA